MQLIIANPLVKFLIRFKETLIPDEEENNQSLRDFVKELPDQEAQSFKTAFTMTPAHFENGEKYDG